MNEKINKLIQDNIDYQKIAENEAQSDGESLGDYGTKEFEADKQDIQYEFEQLKQIQKLVNNLKIQKIDKYRKKKYKYLLTRNIKQTQFQTNSQVSKFHKITKVKNGDMI